MPPKLKYEDVKEESTKRGLILLSKEYKRNNQKLDFMNSEGYKSQMSLANLKFDKQPSYFSKFNDFTLENIQLFLDKRGEGVTLLSTEWVGSGEKLKFRCSCGKEFTRTWEDMYYKTYTVCRECAIVLRGISSRLPLDKVQKRFEDSGLKVKDITQYKGIGEYLEVEDNKGYKGFAAYKHLARGDKMARFDRRVNDKYFIYNLNHWAELNNIDVKVIGYSDKKYHQNRQAVKCVCSCGKIFETSYLGLMYGRYRCPECAKSISYYEKTLQHYLDSLGINYITQYRIPECRNTFSLPFDFYLTEYDYLVEADGEGHYFPCYFNGCSWEQAVDSFRRTKKNDTIKNNFCTDNNRKLLRIPYWDFKNDKYKELITNIIKD